MYCYTVINNLKCVLQELEMWSKDSMEHGTFILKFAECINLRLGYDMIDEIKEIRRYFSDLYEAVQDVLEEYDKTMQPYQDQKHAREVRNLLQKYIKYDKNFLSLLDDLQTISKRHKVWQALIEHIIDEQKYSYLLMKNFKKQLEKI